VKPARNTEAHLQRDLFLMRDVEPGFGWNPLSLAGGRHVEAVPRRAQAAPVARPIPKPGRAVLKSTPVMAKRLAEHEFKPWWMR